MSSSGLAPVVVLLDGEELGSVARGGEPRQGDTINLSSRLHEGRLLACRVVGVERWYGDAGAASAKTFRPGQVLVRVAEVDTKPVVPGWLGASPFAPVVFLANGVELGRTERGAEPRMGEVVMLDSPHRLGRLRAYRVLRIERWPADVEQDATVFEWGDIAVHLVEVEV